MLALDQLTAELAKLPSIGHSSAKRLAYHIIINKHKVLPGLLTALNNCQEVRTCKQCHGISMGDRCAICSNEKRHNGQICVVEEAQNILIIEEANVYSGLYHVLGGAISPINGLTSDKLNFNDLLDRADSTLKELIIATNPNIEGEATAHYIRRMFKDKQTKISRLATGLPSGSDIEFIDKNTLQSAFNGRVAY